MFKSLKAVYHEPFIRVREFIKNSRYRTYLILKYKLRNIPRFTPYHVSINGLNLSMPDSASFLSAYKEIFVERTYAFKSETNSPKILDLGANIGLSVLFFKQLYPGAQITAFEADPNIYTYLERNLHDNGYSDVEIVNKAAWIKNTILQFKPDGADGGRAAIEGDKHLINIEAVNIASLLRDKEFDFLKMDVEGGEEFILPACKNYLAGIKYIFVEYHSTAGRKQSLDNIVSILTEQGFRLHIHNATPSSSPFIKVGLNSGFDLQLNIFGWKESRSIHR